MKSDIEKWTIVIVGLWDIRVFTPEWVGKQLFSGKKVGLEVPLNLTLPPRFNAESLVLIPQNDRVIIGSKDIKEDTLKKAEDLARTTLNSFQDIRINSFGINFGFIEENPSELATLFNLNDIRDLSENGYEVKKTEIVRTLQREGEVLNIRHILGDGVLRMGFNFHYVVGSAKSAIDLLNGQVMRCRDSALDLLKKVYKLTLEEE